MKVSKLKSKANNPRKIDQPQIEKLMQSIKDFPAMMELRPIVYDPITMEVLGGNQRLTACKKLGMKELPDAWVRSADSLTDDEKRRFVIQDNHQSGDWDFDLLTEHWGDIDLEGIGIVMPDASDIGTGEAEEDNYTEPDQLETDIKIGDLFSLRKDGKEIHRLMCGDSVKESDVQELMGNEKADMLLIDPPYNIDYVGGSKLREKIENDNIENFPLFLLSAFGLAKKALNLGAAAYVWHSSTETHNFINMFIQSGFLFKSYIIWNKNNSTFGRSDYQWKHEPCIYGWVDGAAHKWMGDRKQTTVWDIDRPSRSDEHPTMKPIELCAKSIKNSSAKSDTVLDLFLGSGSTMVACHQLDRKCYGMEIDPHYCQVSLDRMRKLDPDIEVVKIDG